MTITLRQLHDADIPAGLRLGAQNGWNQLEADWRRPLDLQPELCYAAEFAGQVVGTACACIFEQVAWINLVLVDQQMRGQGIGTRLMELILNDLDTRQIPSIRLDATPLGRPIYEKLGFNAEYELGRFSGTLAAKTPWPDTVLRATPEHLPALQRLDEQITRTPRGRLLRYLFEKSKDSAPGEAVPLLLVHRPGPTTAAYGSCRPGARAWQVGPCLGERDACEQVLQALGAFLEGQPVYVDVPEGNSPATEWAQAAGLTVQRTLTRMGRGVRIHEDLARLWCSFGPEKG